MIRTWCRLGFFGRLAVCACIVSAAGCAGSGQEAESRGKDETASAENAVESHEVRRASSAPVRFAVIADSRGGDNGVNTAILGEIVEAIRSEQVEFVLMGGDLVTGSKDLSVLESQLLNWRDTLGPLYEAGVRVLPTRGNHDLGNRDAESKAVWDRVFTGEYALPQNGPVGEENITFSFASENVLVLGLDMYVELRQVNQAWVDAQFEKNDRPHVFVFGHEPAFKVLHKDCLDDHPAQRDVLWESIAAEGGRAFFSGHDHFYDHARIDDGDGNPDNDVHQMIVTSGAPLYGDGPYDGENGKWTPVRILHEKQVGYVLVEIDGLDATLTHKSRTGPGVFMADDVFEYRAPMPEEDH